MTALLVTAGLVLLVPELSLANPVVQGLGWGLVSGFTFALLVVMNRRWSATRTATDIAFWQNLLAALALLPFALGGAVGDRHRSARARSCCCSCWGSRARRSPTRCSSAALAVVTAHTASVIAALEPVYGIVLALAFLGEVRVRARSPAAR